MRYLLSFVALLLLLPLFHLTASASGCRQDHGQATIGCTITHMVTPSAADCASCGVPATFTYFVLPLIAASLVLQEKENFKIGFLEHAPPLPPPRY